MVIVLHLAFCETVTCLLPGIITNAIESGSPLSQLSGLCHNPFSAVKVVVNGVIVVSPPDMVSCHPASLAQRCQAAMPFKTQFRQCVCPKLQSLEFASLVKSVSVSPGF